MGKKLPPLPGEPGYDPHKMTIEAAHKAAKKRKS